MGGDEPRWPGHLAQTTRAPFVIGEPEGEPRGSEPSRLAEALGTVADVRVTENIHGQVWSKLLVNSAFSGLGAISGLLYREVVADPTGREAALAVWREGYDVGLAQGIELDECLGVPAEDLVVRSPEEQGRGTTKTPTWLWATLGPRRPRCSRISNGA